MSKSFGYCYNGLPEMVVYEGEFINNLLNGLGKIIFPWGVIYDGFFKDNQLIDGKKIHANKEVHEGEFENNLLSGQGRIVYPNGKIKEGFFRDDILICPKK